MNSKSIAFALFSLLDQEISFEKIAEGFTQYVKKNNLQGLLPNVFWYLEYFLKQKAKKESVEIILAHDVSPEIITDITSFIGTPEGVPIFTRHDSEIIGGFIARYDGVQYDASIKKQLAQLRQAIIYS